MLDLFIAKNWLVCLFQAMRITCAAAPLRVYAYLWANALSKMEMVAEATHDFAVSIQTLSALENAIEPYLDAGYIITSQTELSITLRAPARRFPWALFLLSLLLVWPVALIYLIWFNQRRERTIYARMTSQGDIEIVGFTLKLFRKERRRQKIFDLISILLILSLSLLISFLILRSRIR